MECYIFVREIFGKFIIIMGAQLEKDVILVCKLDVKGSMTKGKPYIIKNVDDLGVWIENDRGFVHQFTMDKIDEFFEAAMSMKDNSDNISSEK
jgi:hypothetical protein